MRIKCPKCSENTLLGPDDIQESSCVSDGEEYRVLYFICSKCKSKVVVQLDDETSLQKLEQCKVLMRKIMRLKHKGKTAGKKLLDDFEKGRKDLSEYRKKLNQKLTSKVLVDNKTGEIYEVFYHEQKVSLL